MIRIYVDMPLDTRQAKRLRERASGCEVRLAADTPARDVDPAFAGCRIAFGNVPADWLTRNDALEWLQLESVGWSEHAGLDWPELGKRLTLTTTAGLFAEPVAETALAGILALLRGVDELARLQITETWRCDAIRMRIGTLEGAEVVFYGFGAINRRIAEIMEPFRCRIRAFTSNYVETELEDALSQADIVICAVPETDSTHRFFDRRRIAMLRKTALLVNLGRGALIDEAALIEALQAGRLGGAVLDVTDDEPIPADHPLWQAPNTLLTQHTGGGTADEIDRKLDVFLANLARFRKGEALSGAANIERGY